MGVGRSKPPPPPPLFDDPWRIINWQGKQSFLQSVNDYQPQPEGRRLRILLHGPIGAGKSSFINSVTSVLEDRMCKPAMAAIANDCFTKKYTTYEIQNGNQGTFYPFVFNDMVGVKGRNSRRSRRIHVKDVEQILNGHVKDGFTFNPESKMTKEDPYFNKSPNVNDKVHVLVYVIDANTVDLMEPNILETIQDIREDAVDLGIPQVAILTKIDEACPEIQKDLKNVYKSRALKEKMQQLSKNVGIPMNSIFPVKNYHEETDLNADINTLLLDTLIHIISDGKGFLDKMPDSQTCC